MHRISRLNAIRLASERCDAIVWEHRKNFHEIHPQIGFVGLPQKRRKISERNGLVERVDYFGRINPCMIKVALLRSAHLPSLFSCTIVSRTSWALPRGTIRFRLHCLRRGCAVYLHAGPLRKPPSLFHSYRCVKLSESGILTARRKLGFPCSRYTAVHQICPDPCFQIGVRRSARALYQVWVKLLEHQTPRESEPFVPFQAKSTPWSLHTSAGIP